MTTTLKRETLEQQWRSYAAVVVPSGASAIQLNESRRAFYAGARAFFGLFTAGLSDDKEPTLEDIQYVDALDRELKQFVKDMAEGRA